MSFMALPPLCELEIDGFSEVAWISHPVEAVVSDSFNSGLEPGGVKSGNSAPANYDP